MVSYYNSLPYSQKHTAANLAYTTGQPWQWTTNYHTPPNHQFLSDMDSPHAHHQMYYSPHHMFHTAASTTSEWHSPSSAADNFSQNAASAHQMLQQHHTPNGATNANGGGSSSSASSGSSSASAGPNSGTNTQLPESGNNLGEQHIADGLPSPPITVSGSEISSPGAPASSSSPHHIAHLNNNNNSPSTINNNNTTAHNNNGSSPVKAQYYEWMKKPSYPAQPTPADVTQPTSLAIKLLVISNSRRRNAKMEQTIKVQPTVKTVLKASPNVSGPSEQNCLMQLAQVHRLRDSEANFDNHRHNLTMKVMRDCEGLGIPLKLNMELYAARQVGRLPFLQSSKLMEDTILGKDELIEFSDILGAPGNYEFQNQPHMVVERSLGIL